MAIHFLRKLYEGHKLTAGNGNKIKKNSSTQIGQEAKKMMRIWLLVIFSSILMVSLSFAQKAAPSKIKEVTLFSNQALIKREAVTKVNKGLNELFLELDVFTIDKDSISAKIFGEGEILSVQCKEVYLKKSPQENIKALEEKRQMLNKSKKILLDEKEILNKKEQFLDSLIYFSQTQVPQDIKTSFPKTDDLEKVLTFLASNFQTINEKKQSLVSRIEETDKEIKVVEKELASLRKPHRVTKKIIELFFNSQKEQEIKIEATYLTQNAFWHPLYKVSVLSTLEELDLIMFSKIQQKTGEDWKDVSLSISNVIPLKGVGLPSPSSWLLDIKRPRPQTKKREKRFSLPKGAMAPMVGEMRELADSEDAFKEEAVFLYAQKEELPLSFEYKIPQILTIESKDKETILPVFTKKLQGRFFYYAVPRINSLTFLVCKARADKELLSGPLNVYFGGRFIGKTFIGEKKAGEKFHVNLGADREIKVKREKIKDKIKETFFGKIERNTIIKEMTFKITVENRKDKPIKIKILDSIPISRTDKVEIKDIKTIPEPIERTYEDKEGVFLWEFALKQKEKREIIIEFVVTYPKDLPLIGL